MKFKTTERYSFGWSDPRGTFIGGSNDVSPIARISEDVKALSIKACRDLWEVRLGDAPVEVLALTTIPKDDPLKGIARKLLEADELIYEVVNLPDRVGRVETYRLKAEYGDN